MAADEAGVGDGRQIEAFTLPTSVTTPAVAARAARAALGDDLHRRGEERDLGRGIDADGVERAQLEGPGGPGRRRGRRR